MLQPIEEGQTGAGRVREEGEKRANDVLPILEEQEEDQITVRRQVLIYTYIIYIYISKHAHPSMSAVIHSVRTAFGILMDGPIYMYK